MLHRLLLLPLPPLLLLLQLTPLPSQPRKHTRSTRRLLLPLLQLQTPLLHLLLPSKLTLLE
jgi:hypothetical protein